MNKFYVYMYLRANSSKRGKVGSPYYVGKGFGKRAFDKNRHSRPPEDSSRIVFVSTQMNESDAFQLEMLLVFFYGRIDKGTGCLRNLTDGGEGPRGRIHSEEEKKKRSVALTGRLCSEETRRKISAALIGKSRKPHTEEWKQANSIRMIGNTHNKGRLPSEETRAKMSVSQKKRGSRSEETKAKMRVARQLFRKRQKEKG